MKKFFNSETYTGRANVAKATYASIAVLYLFYRFRKGSKKKVDMIEETTENSVAIVPPSCVNMAQKMHQNGNQISMIDQNAAADAGGKSARTCPRHDGAGRDGSANKVESESSKSSDSSQSSDSSKSSENAVIIPPVKEESVCRAKQAAAAGEQQSSSTPPRTETDKLNSKNETDQLNSKIDASIREGPEISEPPKKVRKCNKDIILLMPPPEETKEPEPQPNSNPIDKQNQNTLPDDTKISDGNTNEGIVKNKRQSYCARKRLRDLEMAEKEQPQPLTFFEKNNLNKEVTTETQPMILAPEPSPPNTLTTLQTDFENAKEKAIPIIEKKMSVRERYLHKKNQNLPKQESTLNLFRETATKALTECVIC